MLRRCFERDAVRQPGIEPGSGSGGRPFGVGGAADERHGLGHGDRGQWSAYVDAWRLGWSDTTSAEKQSQLVALFGGQRRRRVHDPVDVILYPLHLPKSG